MKILSVHAHFDDYEFTAAGTFEMWKRKLGGPLRAKVIANRPSGLQATV